jgi:hypothetical protein
MKNTIFLAVVVILFSMFSTGCTSKDPITQMMEKRIQETKKELEMMFSFLEGAKGDKEKEKEILKRYDVFLLNLFHFLSEGEINYSEYEHAFDYEEFDGDKEAYLKCYFFDKENEGRAFEASSHEVTLSVERYNHIIYRY